MFRITFPLQSIVYLTLFKGIKFVLICVPLINYSSHFFSSSFQQTNSFDVNEF
jgi:hypothetical protein